MSQKIKHRIDREGKGKLAYGADVENYQKVNGFVMSDDIKDWMYSPTRKHKRYRPLF